MSIVIISLPLMPLKFRSLSLMLLALCYVSIDVGKVGAFSFAHHPCGQTGSFLTERHHISSPLSASPNSGGDREDEFSSDRRTSVSKMAGAAAAVAVGSISSSPSIVNADPPLGEKLIVFSVDNLEGAEGNTGTFVVKLRPDWAPIAVARFTELTEQGFWEDIRFFRVVPGFVAQFGINANPKVQDTWRDKILQDEPVKASNTRGTIAFATSGPNSRTTQIFINTSNKNKSLDKKGFSPFGTVISGMDVVDKLYSEYGEGYPRGFGPDQGRIQTQGNEYLKSKFPLLSYINKVTVK
mmetsp:Transcript_31275/g.61959  ORF Transcript_31275/g.61959 Transcript_31275/m.61959 type:complete len:296 (+) Transcript_31275:56-943(+)